MVDKKTNATYKQLVGRYA